MGKDKLKRFEEVEQFENVFELTDFQTRQKPKGKWHKDVFKNSNPITLELACGKGEYTVNLARKYPDRNFIGVDLKSARLWRGAKTALEESLKNVHFLRIYIDHIEEYFGRDEVDEIWITFPDPYPRKPRISKRLTSPKFLNIYQKILKRDGIIHLKTDSDLLYNYTIEVVSSENCSVVDKVDDIYAMRPDDEILTIKTFYEKKHLKDGKTIHYLAFHL